MYRATRFELKYFVYLISDNIKFIINDKFILENHHLKFSKWNNYKKLRKQHESKLRKDTFPCNKCVLI